jgi:hypothetical protein
MKRTKRIARRLLGYLVVGTIGFIVGVVGLYIYWVRSGPELRIWHTAELTEEFSTDKRESVRTFAEYRKLEDRLFAQLDEAIYAHTETGPAFKLGRYSAGRGPARPRARLESQLRAPRRIARRRRAPSARHVRLAL